MMHMGVLYDTFNVQVTQETAATQKQDQNYMKERGYRRKGNDS